MSPTATMEPVDPTSANGVHVNDDLDSPKRSPSVLKWVYEPEIGEASFQIGCRYVDKIGPDGKTVTHVVPLTPDDFLHPEEDDEFVNYLVHGYAIVDALTTFCARRKRYESKKVKILFKVGVDPNIPGVKPIRPDLICFTNVNVQVDTQSDFNNIFHVSKEGPDLGVAFVLEFGSKLTEHKDMNEKVEIYEKMKVQQYLFIRPRDYEGKSNVLDLHNWVWDAQTQKLKKAKSNKNQMVEIPFFGVKVGRKLVKSRWCFAIAKPILATRKPALTRKLALTRRRPGSRNSSS